MERLTLMENPVYLGDAVYAYFQDDRVELRLNHHDAKGAVCLEIEVLHALIDSRWLFCGLTPEEVEELHAVQRRYFEELERRKSQ